MMLQRGGRQSNSKTIIWFNKNIIESWVGRFEFTANEP